MSAELAILVPVLDRPHRVKPLLDSIEGATPEGPHSVHFICDPADFPQQQAILDDGRAAMPTLCVRGGYAAKVNVAVQHTEAPLLFLAADDLHFHPGWFEAARAKMHDGVGVVGTQDLCNPRTIAGKHATHFLVARWYAELGSIDAPGRLLHEGYDHNFVDDEFLATARARGMYAFADDSIVEHFHPINATAEDDHVYQKGRARFAQDRRLFRQRRPLWT